MFIETDRTAACAASARMNAAVAEPTGGALQDCALETGRYKGLNTRKFCGVRCLRRLWRVKSQRENGKTTRKTVKDVGNLQKFEMKIKIMLKNVKKKKDKNSKKQKNKSM
ncbi:hypothetical protein NQD34_006715 [Periophthalmus magnuspinnatus]|nr:hypothetical protein NQD34_006715 [Periophthalmus magnuspinnatus]